MVAPRTFTEAELNLARTWRRYQESWRAIGRKLGCNEETIRRALDPEFGASRTRGIVAAQSVRRKNQPANRRENCNAAYY